MLKGEREKRSEYVDRANQGRLLEEAWLECLLTQKGIALKTGVPSSQWRRGIKGVHGNSNWCVRSF